MEEGLDFLFVDIAHLLRRNNNLIPVPISSVQREFVDAINVGDLMVVNAKLLQLFDGHLFARVVR